MVQPVNNEKKSIKIKIQTKTIWTFTNKKFKVIAVPLPTKQTSDSLAALVACFVIAVFNLHSQGLLRFLRFNFESQRDETTCNFIHFIIICPAKNIHDNSILFTRINIFKKEKSEGRKAFFDGKSRLENVVMHLN